MRSSLDRRLDRLAACPILRNLHREDLRKLAAHICEATAPAGSVILRAGSKVLHLYFVVSGTLARAVEVGSFELYGAGDVVLVEELLSGSVIAEPLVALSDVELLTVGYRPFVAACQTTEGFALAVLRAALS